MITKIKSIIGNTTFTSTTTITSTNTDNFNGLKTFIIILIILSLINGCIFLLEMTNRKNKVLPT